MENTKELNKKGFWYEDWAFPIFVGLMSAGVYAGTYLFFQHGVGAFNDIGVVAIFLDGMTEYAATGEMLGFGAAAAFGASFLFARVLEGSLVGILDIGGSIMTGVGIGLPAFFLMNGMGWTLESFPAALATGLVAGVLIGIVVLVARKFTVGQANSTFGADVMMGAGNQSGRFMGPLILIAAFGASVPVGIGALIGALGFYAWKKPIEGGAILGAMLVGLLFPIYLG